jgi:methylenetetrahydrofolate reductase (NADPH)
MRISDRLAQPSPCFSFEFFPPKTDAGMESLFQTVAELSPLEPGFVSVTYGAGGSTRDRTLEVVARIKKLGLEAMAHLTCVGHSRSELRTILGRLQAAGIENLLALRGDPPKGEATFVPPPDGFTHAEELVSFIKSEGLPFCIGGAAHPEGHMENASRQADLDNLKRKVDAGVEFLICQLFFDNAFYFDFVERARKAGIHVPIVPGIMPITNVEQVDRFTRTCGATVPMRLRLQLEKLGNDPAAVQQLGVAHATVQCMELLNRGVRHLHFFTLNKSPATKLIVSALRGAV